jgi:hypothetical protein
MAYGITCSSTEYQVQVAEEQLVMGFTHSGHCSAPTTIDPPFVGVAVGDPVVVVGVPDGELLPPHAAATSPATAMNAIARINTRSRTAPPFVVGPVEGPSSACTEGRPSIVAPSVARRTEVIRSQQTRNVQPPGGGETPASR